MQFEQKKPHQSVAQNEDLLASRLLSLGTNGFAALLILAATALIIYTSQFGTLLSSEKDDWGTFGDFLGGLLNPALGFLTVYLVLINAKFQRQELRNSVTEMRNSNLALHEQNSAIQTQNFQNAFFNWIISYRQTVDKAQFSDSPNIGHLQGTSALAAIYGSAMSGLRIENHLADDGLNRYFVAISNYDDVENEEVAMQVQLSILGLWRDVRHEYENVLDPILRSLFGLAQWIFEQSDSTITIEKKNEYFRILASHLSNIEVTLLLYEALNRNTGLAKNLNKLGFFKPLVWSDPTVCFLTSHGSLRANCSAP